MGLMDKVKGWFGGKQEATPGMTGTPPPAGETPGSLPGDQVRPAAEPPAEPSDNPGENV